MTSLADYGPGSRIQEAPGSVESFCIGRERPKSECRPPNNRLRSTGQAKTGRPSTRALPPLTGAATTNRAAASSRRVVDACEQSSTKAIRTPV